MLRERTASLALVEELNAESLPSRYFRDYLIDRNSASFQLAVCLSSQLEKLRHYSQLPLPF